MHSRLLSQGAATAWGNYSSLNYNMIRPHDFDIEIGQSERGTFVRVTHKPTGNQRIADPVAPNAVGKTRDSFIAELRRMLYLPKDIRVEIGISDRGEYIRVIHVASGVDRCALRRERTKEELLDEVLEDLYDCESNDELGDQVK